MKNRIITWDEFAYLVNCAPNCPLWSECMYGYPKDTERTATNCKIWRRLPTTEKGN